MKQTDSDHCLKHRGKTKDFLPHIEKLALFYLSKKDPPSQFLLIFVVTEKSITIILVHLFIDSLISITHKTNYDIYQFTPILMTSYSKNETVTSMYLHFIHVFFTKFSWCVITPLWLFPLQSCISGFFFFFFFLIFFYKVKI